MKKERMIAQCKKWERIRKIGKRQFIIKFGVIGWGIPAAIAWSIAISFITKDKGVLPELAILLGIALIFFSLGGYLWGLWLWNWSESFYKKHSKEVDENTSPK